MVDEQGTVVIMKNNAPRYLLIEFSQAESMQAAADDDVLSISSRLALAPMAGVTDAAFRHICRELGAAMTTTEMVSARALCYNDKKTRDLLLTLDGRSEEFIVGQPEGIADKLTRIDRYLGLIAPSRPEGYYRTVNVKYNQQIICRQKDT